VEHAVDNDHVRHECWPITDPSRIASIAELVRSQPVLIADGHHRYETAVTYQAECGQAGRETGDHDLVMTLVVELSEEHLSVQAIHRLLTGLPNGFDLPAALAPWFELSGTDPPDRTIAARMAADGALAVITRAGTWLARPRPEVCEQATHDLDSSRLDVALAGLPPHELTYQHGWDRSLAAVHSGEADAAVLLRPATVEQIGAISRGGVRMPPKTTFFWPKPRTGMVVRELID
jgi:uncharacterized protein (DUF1015 family)